MVSRSFICETSPSHLACALPLSSKTANCAPVRSHTRYLSFAFLSSRLGIVLHEAQQIITEVLSENLSTAA